MQPDADPSSESDGEGERVGEESPARDGDVGRAPAVPPQGCPTASPEAACTTMTTTASPRVLYPHQAAGVDQILRLCPRPGGRRYRHVHHRLWQDPDRLRRPPGHVSAPPRVPGRPPAGAYRRAAGVEGRARASWRLPRSAAAAGSAWPDPSVAPAARAPAPPGHLLPPVPGAHDVRHVQETPGVAGLGAGAGLVPGPGGRRKPQLQERRPARRRRAAQVRGSVCGREQAARGAALHAAAVRHPVQSRVGELVSAWFLLTGRVRREEGEGVDEASLQPEMEALIRPCVIQLRPEEASHLQVSMPTVLHHVQYLSKYGWPRQAQAKYEEVGAQLAQKNREYSSLLRGRHCHPDHRRRASELLRLIQQLKAQLRGMCSDPLVPWGTAGPGPCVKLLQSLQRKRKRLGRGVALEVLSRKLVKQAYGRAEPWPPVLDESERARAPGHWGVPRAWVNGSETDGGPAELPPPVLLSKFEFVCQTLRAWAQQHRAGRWVATSEWVRVLDELDAYLRLRQQLEPRREAPWQILRFYGQTPKEARASAEALFWSPAPARAELVLLLLSKRAGGVGLNLTFADGLLVLEPGHTYAQDSQVVGRVQRLGGAGPGPEPRQVLCTTSRTRARGPSHAKSRVLPRARKVAVTELDRARTRAGLDERYTPEERLGRTARATPASAAPSPLEAPSPPHKKRRLVSSPEPAAPADPVGQPEELLLGEAAGRLAEPRVPEEAQPGEQPPRLPEVARSPLPEGRPLEERQPWLNEEEEAALERQTLEVLDLCGAQAQHQLVQPELNAVRVVKLCGREQLAL
eukprot:g12641.t1